MTSLYSAPRLLTWAVGVFFLWAVVVAVLLWSF